MTPNGIDFSFLSGSLFSHVEAGRSSQLAVLLELRTHCPQDQGWGVTPSLSGML